MNLSTGIVLLIFIVIVAFSIKTIRKDKKNGKSSCGGDCSGCGSASLCHHPQSLFEEYKKHEFDH